MKKIIPIFFSLLSIPFFFANAASFYCSPIGEVEAGDKISLEVGINDNEYLVKAVEGVITFDDELLEFVKIDESGSEWSEESSLYENEIFFNTSQIKEFEGRQSRLFDVYFNVLKDGNPNLYFSSGKILVKEGENYNLEELMFTPIEEFRVVSPTHPSEDLWYANNNVKFLWSIPFDAEELKLLIDEKEDSFPSISYTDLITEKEIELEDGIWYFHIRYKNAEGWQPIIHKKVMIDTKKPYAFNVDIAEERVPKIVFNAEDETSGIQGYEIIIPSKNYSFFTNGNETYFPFSTPSDYKVIIKVLDKAGNHIEKERTITVKYLNPPIVSKILTGSGKISLIGKIDNPSLKIYVSIEGPSKVDGLAEVSENGTFVFTSDTLEDGTYRLFLTTIGEDSVSEKAEKAVFIVQADEITYSDGQDVKLLLVIIIGLILTFLIIYISRKFLQEQENKKPKKRGRPRKNKKRK